MRLHWLSARINPYRFKIWHGRALLKQNRFFLKAVALLLALGLAAAGCGDDDSSDQAIQNDSTQAEDCPEPATPSSDTPAASETAPTTAVSTQPAPVPASTALPGEGVSLTMGRANWDTGYFQAALLRQLLQELGYEVSDPSEAELGPSLAYLSMAEGDIDFWANSWYTLHNSWLLRDLPDGSIVGDHISRIGGLMSQGLVQGYLITKSFAEEYCIRTLDDLNSNPDALTAYDKQDVSPDDGIADIYGCPQSWTCDDIISSQIAFSDWENITQIIAGYEAMIAEATSRVDDGEPVVVYTWTPSPYIASLRPGDNVMWLGVEEVLDASNPLESDGGEGWTQTPGQVALGSDTCLYILDNDSCQLGWNPADITVTARNDLLENHPAAKRLFEVVVLNPVDVSIQLLAQRNDEAPEDLAAQWLADNRDLADSWIAEALAAA